MRNKAYIERSFSGIFIALLTNLDLLLAPVNRGLTAKNVFICCIFNESTIFKEKSLVLTFLYVVMIVLFMLLYGNYFHDHLSNTGIYIYLRNRNRFYWYKRYTTRLLLYSVIYTFSYTFSVFMMSLYHAGEKIEGAFIYIALYVWFVLTVIVYIMTLIENIISIKYGNIIGEIVAVSILALLLQLCLRQQEYILFQKYEILRYVNPMNGMKLYTLSLSEWKAGIAVIYLLEIGIVWFLGLFILKITDILDRK